MPFYGIHDFTDRHALKGSGAGMIQWLEKTVMPCPLVAHPALWDLASPIAQVWYEAPLFLILHGTNDSLASGGAARRDAFRSVHAVTRFRKWARATIERDR